MSKVIILSDRNNHQIKYDKKLLFKSRLEINSSRRKNYIPLSISNNNITQNEEEISNTNMNNINEISDKENKELNTNLDIDKETEKKESQKISIEYDNDNNNFYDASLEYSKSKSYLGNDLINNNSPNLNNINNNNYNILNQHHRQISYHNNSKSINKRKKEDSNSNNKLSKNNWRKY